MLIKIAAGKERDVYYTERKNNDRVSSYQIGTTMESVRLVLNAAYGNYVCQDASGVGMSNMGIFLSRDLECNTLIFKKWASNGLERKMEGIGGNFTFLEKEDDHILISDLYSEEEESIELKIGVQQFIQLLDDWQKKVCDKKPKEVIIEYKDGKFVVETKDS